MSSITIIATNATTQTPSTSQLLTLERIDQRPPCSLLFERAQSACAVRCWLPVRFQHIDDVGASAVSTALLDNAYMPANLTADYRKAEAAYREARDPAERLACLKEMLRTIPKHKGTDHLQADIKTRIKELTDDLSGPAKGARRGGPVHAVRPEGAAQIALLGPPNAGKSSLHARLTGSKTDIGPYPLTTHEPVPGMLPFEDTHLQLVDLPPISADFMEPWIVNALQPADGALLIVDISDPECVDQVPALLEQLASKKVYLVHRWPGIDDPAAAADTEDDENPDPFRIELPTFLVANKSDLDPDPDDVRILEELTRRELSHVSSVRRRPATAATTSASGYTRAADRARLYQIARQTVPAGQAVYGPSRRYDSRRRAPRAQRLCPRSAFRPRLGRRRFRRSAGRARPRRQRRRDRGAAPEVASAGRLRGQFDRDDEPASVAVPGLYRAAVEFDRAPRDRQPDARAGRRESRS